jgi:hypothetical protein
VQTFLPYPGFRASAAVLDERRLGKQRVEVFQVLRALTWPAYGWKHHPAVRMWRGFVPALVAYGLAVCDEWEARSRADATRAALLEFTAGRVPDVRALRDDGRLPPWLGHDVVHASHQSALVRKDPEHYRRFFPDVPDDLPYAWPRAAFPVWPLARDGALPLADAQALLGVDEVPAEAAEVVRAVVGGADGELDGPGAATYALVAALARPGATVWVTPGEPMQDEPPAPPPRETTGALAKSIARPPSAEDLAAMRTEAGTAPEVRFLRTAQLGPQPPSGVGLVVLEGDQPRPPWPVPALRVPFEPHPLGTPPA